MFYYTPLVFKIHGAMRYKWKKVHADVKRINCFQIKNSAIQFFHSTLEQKSVLL